MFVSSLSKHLSRILPALPFCVQREVQLPGGGYRTGSSASSTEVWPQERRHWDNLGNLSVDPAWGRGRQMWGDSAPQVPWCSAEVELCSPCSLLAACHPCSAGHGSAPSDGAAGKLRKRPCRQQPECAWKEDGVTVVLGPRRLAAVSVNQLYESLWGQKSNKITEEKPMLPLCTFHLSSHFILPSHKISSLWPDLVM